MHVSDKSFAFSLSLVYMLVSDKSFAFSLSLSLYTHEYIYRDIDIYVSIYVCMESTSR